MAPLTREEKVAAFKVVTRSLTHWYGDEIIAGVTDERLEELLKNALGIFGGSGGPCRLSICHQGCGLKIWAGPSITFGKSRFSKARPLSVWPAKSTA